MRRAAWPAVVAVAVVAMQLIAVEKTNPPVRGDIPAPPAVKATLRAACYDCHSNQTRWPWYGAAAPVSWLVAHEVNEGRRRLNFSDWEDYAADPGTARHKLEEIADFVGNGAMAPWYYRMMHPQARLSPVQRATIIDWAQDRARRIAN